jgi:alpha-1,2-mannosyltransferase
VQSAAGSRRLRASLPDAWVWGVVLVGVSAIVWVLALRAWHWYMGDLIVYRAGSNAFLHGHDLYTVVSGRHDLHFTYPPFAAIVLSPLAMLPLAGAKAVLSALTFGALATSLVIVARRLEDEAGPFHPIVIPAVLAASLWLEPVRATFDFGQINALVMVLVVVDVLAVRQNRFGGALLGVAAAIKLTPLAFVPYLFLIGRRRAAGVATATFAACLGVSYLLDRNATTRYWGRHRFLQAHRIGRVENASNQSVRGILARLLRTTGVPGWWLVVAALLFIAVLLVARSLHARGFKVWAFVAMAVAMLVCSPVSWSHHWVWCSLMLLVCVDIVRRVPRLWVAVSTFAVMVPFASGLVFWAPHSAHLELRDSYGQELLSATYVLAGLGLVALMAVLADGSLPREASITVTRGSDELVDVAEPRRRPGE